MNNNELKMLQSLPLDIKVGKSILRIKEFISHYRIDGVYVSFSGGKDSSVLLDVVCKFCVLYGYKKVYVAFSDTGLEFPELKQFVGNYVKYLSLKYKIDVILDKVRPNMSFKQVVSKYGYPVISKKVSRSLHDLQNPTSKNVNIRNLYLTGITSTGRECKSRKLAKKYYPLINADFRIHNRCCDKMKKEPLHKYEKDTNRKPIIGMLAEEGEERKKAYMQHGCINWKRESCNPLGFWKEQDVLQYIWENKIPVASVYGQLIIIDGKFKFTGEQRTGCIFCMYGCHLEKGEDRRFIRLSKTHPQLYNYCINGGEYDEEGKWVPSNKGLGLGHVLDQINVDYKEVK